MRTSGSTIRISQRTLPPEGSLSPTQERAQELASNLIQSYSSRHTTREGLEFLRDHAPCEFMQDGEHLIIERSSTLPWIRDIPPSYGVKGGAAREELVSVLGLREPRQPRDIDLVRRGHHRVPDDDVVARVYMAKDYSHGARVELIRDMENHLVTRDLTINEVVVVDGQIYATLLCLLDSFGHVIRPSRHRGGMPVGRPKRVQALFGLTGESLLKMARLYAEGSCNGESWSMGGIPEEVTIYEFDLAIHLNKSFQTGREVALAFLRTCEILSLIKPTGDRLRNTLDELAHLRHGERGLFPDVPDKEWER